MMTEVERLRRDAGLSQTELAQKADVGLSSVVAVENDRDVTKKIARKIAAVFSRHVTVQSGGSKQDATPHSAVVERGHAAPDATSAT